MKHPTLRQKLLLFCKRHRKTLAVSGILLIWYYFCLPTPLFDRPFSTVINSREGQLLGAQIATDGQWRFPERDSLPYKFKQSLLFYEDEYFMYHPGINPISTLKAFIANLKSRKIIRGGSTLTQQTIRLARNGKKRTYFEKLIEAIQATRLELRYSKNTILNLYASHAPFGGNVVGLDVAAWRYFGTTPEQLSWAESATLAVLPNAPKLIYPGKNQQALKNKRDQLLKKLLDHTIIDSDTYKLAITEPLPQKPHSLPQLAPHLLARALKEKPARLIGTTLSYKLQEQANAVVKNYYEQYKQSEIYNMATLIIDVETREVLSYIGNTPTNAAHQKDVDVITAPRSTGSILKPFLYASMLDDADLLPQTLVADIPTIISGYRPQNFNQSYEGAVAADDALARSLNIPFVLLLQEYGIYRFYDRLQKLQLSNIDKHPNHYGLSLILGGAESNLWDLCRAYSTWVGTLNYFNNSNGKYRSDELQQLRWDSETPLHFKGVSFEKETEGAGAIWLTLEALREVNRPEGDEAWRYYDSSLQIAWKTGTSYGGRDAWAIGMNKKYVVGVWVGNASGEGRPSLSGVRTAAPVLFDLFNLLPRSKWFATPYNDLDLASICIESGYLAQNACVHTRDQWIPHRERKTLPCPYHRFVHLDASEKYRVNSSCKSIENMQTKPWFVLPPIMGFYYKHNHSNYKNLPPYKEECIQSGRSTPEFIYPKHQAKIYLTKNFYGTTQPFVAKAVTDSEQNVLYWYLDQTFLGTTRQYHEMPVQASSGSHLLTIVDQNGREKTISIQLEN